MSRIPPTFDSMSPWLSRSIDGIHKEEEKIDKPLDLPHGFSNSVDLFRDVPVELVGKVLSHLSSIKARLVCRLVCSKWNKIILTDATVWAKEFAVLKIPVGNLRYLISKVEELRLNIVISRALFGLVRERLLQHKPLQMVPICLAGLKSYKQLLQLGLKNDPKGLELFKGEFKKLVWPYDGNGGYRRDRLAAAAAFIVASTLAGVIVQRVCFSAVLYKAAEIGTVDILQNHILSQGNPHEKEQESVIDPDVVHLDLGSASANQAEQKFSSDTSDDDLYNDLIKSDSDDDLSHP